MRISDVLERVDRLCPNQFDDSEKIAWADELGAMLQAEYKKEYGVCEAVYTDKGIELPEEVTADEVCRIYADGRAVPKLSLLCTPDKRHFRIVGVRRGEKVETVYQKRYTPIGDIESAETLCAAPYDSMYIDYLLAKIYFYNRDMDGYGQHVTAFNQMLLSYRNHLKSKADIDKGARIVGWI